MHIVWANWAKQAQGTLKREVTVKEGDEDVVRLRILRILA